MKKNYWYVALVGIFIIAVSFVVVRFTVSPADSKTIWLPIKPRNGNNNIAEWNAAKLNSKRLITKLKANGKETKAALALANAYNSEGRISGDVMYYDDAAMKTVMNVLKYQPDNFEAILLKSMIELSQHHFSDALQTAKSVEQKGVNSAFMYGLLVDANVEMGNYDEALIAADKMVSIRPDLRSFSRISYLREIYGDNEGAIEAMKLAVQAGLTGDEKTEWCRAQLGKLYENNGDLTRAALQYNLSLAARPGYVQALAGLGRIAAFSSKNDSALYYFEQANKLTEDVTIKQGLSLAYANVGKIEESKKLANAVIERMKLNSNAAEATPETGHYSDKELAYAYAQRKDNLNALRHALLEYNRRPKNIEVNETVAWVYYKKNDFKSAIPFLETALSTKSMKPQLLCLAGLLYTAAGEKSKAKTMLTLGLRKNALMPLDLLQESKQALQTL